MISEWITSNWEALLTVQCDGAKANFSIDALQSSQSVKNGNFFSICFITWSVAVEIVPFSGIGSLPHDVNFTFGSHNVHDGLVKVELTLTSGRVK